MKVSLFSLFGFLVPYICFGMGSSAELQSAKKFCYGFKSAMRDEKLDFKAVFTKQFLESHPEAISDKDYFRQKPRLMTKVFINEKYHPKDFVLLESAQFSAMKGEDDTVLCRVFKNGESEQPELHTLREIRLVQDSGSWKVSEVSSNKAW